VVENPVPVTAEEVAEMFEIPVLVVDDNSTNRRVLAAWLSQWGMLPVLAESGAAAMRLIDSLEEPIPLVLSDVHMPGMDGFELIGQIKAQSRTPIVIMLTSDSYSGDVARSRELGAEAYLIKPVRRDELRQAILRILKAQPPRASAPALSAKVSTLGIVELARRTARTPKGGLHILVADDHLVNTKLAVTLLEKEGHSTVAARNGEEALAAMELESFDVVLMDIQMPKMNGFETTGRIRAREKATGRTPTLIVAMTAHAMNGDRERCLDAGMDGYVSKPIRKSLLLAAIQDLVVGRIDKKQAVKNRVREKQLEKPAAQHSSKQASPKQDSPVAASAEKECG
jgi:two-component system, sensor histidine kinase and response regulator